VTPHPGRDGERQKLFRRMEWVFVYAPPLLALMVGTAGGAFLAWFVRIEGTSFATRWLGASCLLLGGTALLYGIHYWWSGRGR
jgi:hypothetical protein